MRVEHTHKPHSSTTEIKFTHSKVLISGTREGGALGMCVMCIIKLCYQHVPLIPNSSQHLLQHFTHQFTMYQHVYVHVHGWEHVPLIPNSSQLHITFLHVYVQA